MVHGWLRIRQIHILFFNVSSVTLRSLSRNCFTINNQFFTIVEKKTLILLLPYLGCISLQTRTKLRKSFQGILNCCKLQIVFKSQSKLTNVSDSKCLEWFINTCVKGASLPITLRQIDTWKLGLENIMGYHPWHLVKLSH